MSDNNTVVTQETARELVLIDNGKPTLYNPAATGQLWRTAKLFASSDLVPAAYKDKPENCFIAMEMAERMGIAPFAMIQNLVVIKGKPSMEAKLITALVNDSGMFIDPIEYEVIGEDPYADDYRVRAFAVRAKTNKLCQGPWITYRMVKGEGWLTKDGSKWKTMPELMFMYRAASYFAKIYCSNITMGMQTREEMEDLQVEEIREVADSVKTRFEERRNEQVQQIEQQQQGQTTVQTTQTGTTEETGTTDPPKRERGKPSHNKQRRTATEVAEDQAADEADALAAQGAQTVTETVDTTTGEVLENGDNQGRPPVDDESDWPDAPGTQTEPAQAVQQTTAEKHAEQKQAEQKPAATLPAGGVTLF